MSNNTNYMALTVVAVVVLVVVLVVVAVAVSVADVVTAPSNGQIPISTGGAQVQFGAAADGAEAAEAGAEGTGVAGTATGAAADGAGTGSYTSMGKKPETLKSIYFAGGCFWGVEEYFSRIPGVIDVTSGYANGTTDNPTYEDVCYKGTGHAETVHVLYDPAIVSLTTLTEQLFRIIDPISKNKQGNDVGVQYRTGVYYADEADVDVIRAVFAAEQSKYNMEIAVELLPLAHFYLAEDYHQDYLKKNPNGYCHIDFCLLDDLLANAKLGETAEIKVDPSKYSVPPESAIKKLLTDEQYLVTQECSTEMAFTGEHWDNKKAGLYVDIVTGEPLFSSADKYDSGSGWPSFTMPIDPDVILRREDNSYGMKRIEIKSRVGGAHLGHVFEDGPEEKGGQRYCVNSASLRFIPYDEMIVNGYGEFMPLCEIYGG